MKTPSFITQDSTSIAPRATTWSKTDCEALLHPDDRVALATLDQIPGFKKLVNCGSALTVEKIFRVQALANFIRVDSSQTPQYYQLLTEVCERFGIRKVPEMFIEQSPIPGAYTLGASNYFVVVTSGLLENFTREEVQFALAHECGHILAEHPLYNMMIHALGYGLSCLPLKLDKALEIPMYAWSRMSELSADRAALAWSGNVDSARRALTRILTTTGRLDSAINPDAYQAQIEEYENLIADQTLEKTFNMALDALQTHPTTVARVSEMNKWSQTSAFTYLSKKLGTYAPTCPKCGAPMRKNSQVCVNGHFC